MCSDCVGSSWPIVWTTFQSSAMSLMTQLWTSWLCYAHHDSQFLVRRCVKQMSRSRPDHRVSVVGCVSIIHVQWQTPNVSSWHHDVIHLVDCATDAHVAWEIGTYLLNAKLCWTLRYVCLGLKHMVHFLFFWISNADGWEKWDHDHVLFLSCWTCWSCALQPSLHALTRDKCLLGRSELGPQSFCQ